MFCCFFVVCILKSITFASFFKNNEVGIIELKNRILKVAIDMIKIYGIKRMRIDDICQELQISKKTFYTVFQTKNELIASILQSIRKEKIYSKKSISEDINAIDYILSNVGFLRHKPMEAKRFMQIHLDLERYYPDIYLKHKQELEKNAQTFMETFIGLGIKQGVFREEIDVEFMKILTADIFGDIFPYSQRYKLPISQTADNCIDSVFRLICTDKGLAYYQMQKTNQNINCKKIKG